MKRIIPEKTRFQPMRNVKTREEYRKLQIEGSSNLHKNIGTKVFQRKGRGWSRGFRRLRQKYIEAAEKISSDDKKGKDYKIEYSTCINTCFAQQVSANKGFREYGEKAVTEGTHPIG